METACKPISPREECHFQGVAKPSAGRALRGWAGAAAAGGRARRGRGCCAPAGREERAPGHRLMPGTAAATGHAACARQKTYSRSSPHLFPPAPPGGALWLLGTTPIAASSRPALWEPLAKPSLTDGAPVPSPWAGQSPRHRPRSSAVPAPLPGPARAPRGCSRPPAARQGGSSQCQACVFVVWFRTSRVISSYNLMDAAWHP